MCWKGGASQTATEKVKFSCGVSLLPRCRLQRQWANLRLLRSSDLFGRHKDLRLNLRLLFFRQATVPSETELQQCNSIVR